MDRDSRCPAPLLQLHLGHRDGIRLWPISALPTAIANGEKTAAGIDGARFTSNMDQVKHYVDKRGALGKFYWLFTKQRQMDRHCAEIHVVVDRMIADHLDYKKHLDILPLMEKGNRKFVLLDELAEETQNLRELRKETLPVLAAGRDPAAALMSWIFYMLIRNLRVFDKLHLIVVSEFGEES